MRIQERLLFDSDNRKCWSIHEGREHIGFLEASKGGYTARRVDGKQLKQPMATKQLACAWLLGKRLGLESKGSTRTLVRVHTAKLRQRA